MALILGDFSANPRQPRSPWQKRPYRALRAPQPSPRSEFRIRFWKHHNCTFFDHPDPRRSITARLRTQSLPIG